MARLFFAIWPPGDVRDRVAELARSLPLQPGARLLVPQNLHLTLAFLGEVDEQTCESLKQGASLIEAVEVTFKLDNLEKWQKPRIACLLPSEYPAALGALAQRLVELARASGISMQDRPYRPHVTLARKVSRAMPEHPVTPISWKAEEFRLVESISTENGVKYESRARWPLKIVR